MDTVHHIRAPLTTTAPTAGGQAMCKSEADRLNSDAVLNCPGCMSVLTTDCQRFARRVYFDRQNYCHISYVFIVEVVILIRNVWTVNVTKIIVFLYLLYRTI